MYKNPPASSKTLKSKKNFVEIWYNPNKWKKAKNFFSPAAEFSLMHSTGEGYAIFIIETVKIPRKSLKAKALKNAKKAAPNAYISTEKIVKVNGKDVLIINIKGTIKKIKFIYHSAYCSGPEGVFQVITYTSTDLFNKYSQDFDEILAGIIIKSKKK